MKFQYIYGTDNSSIYENGKMVQRQIDFFGVLKDNCVPDYISKESSSSSLKIRALRICSQ